MNLGVSGRARARLAVLLGVYFALAGATDLLGAVLVVPGLVPAESSQTLRLAVGCVVLLSALCLFFPKSARQGAVVLAVLWTMRFVWDITGAQEVSFWWLMLYPLLAIVIGRWQPLDGQQDAPKE